MKKEQQIHRVPTQILFQNLFFVSISSHFNLWSEVHSLIKSQQKLTAKRRKTGEEGLIPLNSKDVWLKE